MLYCTELEAVAGVDDRPPVVDAHKVHRPSTDVEQQHRGFVGQQVRLGHKRREALGEKQHIVDRDAVFPTLVAKLGRLACIAEQVLAERRLLSPIAGQRQPGRDGHATLAGCAAGLQFLCDSGQRQQVVVVVGGLVPLDRLPPAAANKKTPAEREHVLAGVGFAVTKRRYAGREGTVSCFDGVVAVVDANSHGKPHFLYVEYTVIYLQGRELVPSRVAMRINEKSPASGLKPEVGQFLTHQIYGATILRSLAALPFHPAGGDVRLSLDQVILLLSLVGGSIYATASLTIKILEHLQKKKD